VKLDNKHILKIPLEIHGLTIEDIRIDPH